MAIVRRLLGLCLVLVLLLWADEARAGRLADRLAQFPHWESKAPVSAAEGDLVYPDWMEGTWNVTSTLVEQVAPLAPEVVTPGFESNRRYLNQPVSFLVRFHATNDPLRLSPSATQTAISDRVLRFIPLKIPSSPPSPLPRPGKSLTVVADRAFNGLNIAQAYLGDRTIQSVKVDPSSPNRQITFLRTGRQLVSIVTGRASESPAPARFVATEVSNQVFRGTSQPYFNQVETTTAYQQVRPTEASSNASSSPQIEADQVTAVYLSPQDTDYFKALNRPVALYRYRLELQRVEPQ